MELKRLYTWSNEPKLPRRDFALFRRLIKFASPYKKYFFLSVILLIGIACLNLIKPVLMGGITSAAQAKDLNALFWFVCGLIGLVIINQCLMVLQMYATQLGGSLAISFLRERLFAFIQRLQVRFFDETATGRLVTRMINDMDGVSEFFSSGTLNIIGDLVLMLGTFIGMAILNIKLAISALVLLPGLVFVTNFLRRLTRRAYEQIRVHTARMNVLLSEQIFGLSTIQAYAQEEFAQDEFNEVNSAFRETNKKALFYEALMEATMEVATTLCLSIIFAGVIWKIPGYQNIPFSTIIIFFQYLRQFLEPISDFSNKYNLFQNAMTCADRIFGLMDNKNDLESESAENLSDIKSVIPLNREQIVFNNVSFCYKKDAPLFSGLTFSIKKGEKIALMGATGSGKSTIIHLLQRFYRLDAGKIFVFGQDSSLGSVDSWRKQFALVPQELFLFPGTILSNIAIDEEFPDEQRARFVIEQLGVSEFIDKKGGLLSVVDERGSNFSQGERQLISFARALYSKGEILLLDEATANIDSATEEILHNALQRLLVDKTAIVIAHRLSTIKYVDRILLFKHGELVEQGTHHELMAKKGYYYQLHELDQTE